MTSTIDRKSESNSAETIAQLIGQKLAKAEIKLWITSGVVLVLFEEGEWAYRAFRSLKKGS